MEIDALLFTIPRHFVFALIGAMKSDLYGIMLKQFIKTKILVIQNINTFFNLHNSYGGAQKKRDRSKRSHNRQSPIESDAKQQRRTYKIPIQPHAEKPNEKVSRLIMFALNRNTQFQVVQV